MFKKSMIALAVMAMATGASAAQMTSDLDRDWALNEGAVDIKDAYIGPAKNVDRVIDATSINVVNSTKNKSAVYTEGRMTIKSKGDITLESAFNPIFVGGHKTENNVSLNMEAAGDITIKGQGWAIKSEKNPNNATAESSNNKGVTVKAKGDITINTTNGISNNGGADSVVTVSGKNVSITATGAKAISGTYGTTNIVSENDLTINGGEHSAVTGLDGTLTLEAKGKTTINGDINFDRAKPGAANATEGTINITNTGTTVINGNVSAIDGGTMNISLAGAGSQLNGAILTNKNEENLTPTTNIGFKQGATWTVKGQSNVSNLALDGGTVDLNGQHVEVDVMGKDSVGTIRKDVGANGENAKNGSFTVKTPNNATLNVDLVQDADVVTSEIAKSALSTIKTADDANADQLKVQANVKEGLVNPGTTFGQDGTVLATSGNALMRDTLQLAQTSSLSLNRILMNDVRKRMGDLRSSEGTHGAWARYDGGRLSSDGGFENDFHTIQVGVDTMPLDNGVRFGLAGSYTKGDAEYARGDADMDAFGLAAYVTWLGDNGMFVDGVARMAKASNDLTVDRDFKGQLDSLAVSLSGEVGWRFPVTERAYVEPQFEATYTYIDGEKMSLSNGTKSADYEIGAFDSFLTRAGVVAGYTCPNNKGDVYVRASAVHEFLGDSEIIGKTGNQSNKESIDGKDTWIEYGIGANFNLTPTTYLWADLERTSGASVETDFRATVGVRYAF